MSLINEALKKAQKMRQAPEAAPPAGAEAAGPVPRVVKRRSPVQARKVVLAVVSIVGGFLLLAVAAVYFLIPDTTPPEIVHRPVRPKAVPAATAAKEADAVPTVTAPTFTEPAAVEPPPAEVAGTNPPATPSDAVAATAPAAVGAVTPTAAPVAPASTPEPPPAPVANPRVYDYLDTLRVTGIRASATDPKVLMNDRVFRLNDVVDRTLGLRITAIAPSGLTFTDESGFVYEKTF